MASALDEELKKMVKQWQDLQKSQAETSDTIAEFKTDFTEQMAELTEELRSDIDELDMSAEAAANGKATIQAFIDAAEEMEPRVRSAYAKLGAYASAAMSNASGNYDNPVNTHGWYSNAYATGTEYATPGLAVIGEKGPELVMLQGGEKILTASETRELRKEIMLLQRELPSHDSSDTTATFESVKDAERYIEVFRSVSTSIPGYAVGTDSAAPGLALVGEKGPELVMLQGGEKILTAEETRELQREYVRFAPEFLAYINTYASGTENAKAGLAIVGEAGTEAVIYPQRIEAEEAIYDPPAQQASGSGISW